MAARGVEDLEETAKVCGMSIHDLIANRVAVNAWVQQGKRDFERGLELADERRRGRKTFNAYEDAALQAVGMRFP